jgi:hypothetical protein
MTEPAPPEVQMVYSALEAEATKWHRLSADMRRAWMQVDFRDLLPTAFMLPTTASALPGAIEAAGYALFQQWMMKLYSQATTEFDQLGAALERALELYMQADLQSAEQLNGVALDAHAVYGDKPPKQGG